MITNQKDEKQKKILEELLHQGSQPYTSIADSLGMHHSTVKKYITEYEESNIILGYSVDVAFERMSELYIVLFRCDPFTERDSELLKERLKKKMIVSEDLKVLDCYFTVGEFQTYIVLTAEDVLSVHRYLNFLINSYDYLRSYVVLQVSRTNARNLQINKDWKGLERLVDFKEL
ncbi:MAG: Lrp/AsnC family transcriptional regulator [Theionarchaea archaeon]|nr:Lrp/AsnC family transcriptional regulator [Theionarchaea archaeon]MBU7036533.1 Lrp/AsnC family transcriptional regulator [Theionarchaea archaeon]